MKKFAKGSLLTAGILAALGCVLCLISALAGGRSFTYWARNDERVMESLDRVANRLNDAFSGFHFFGDWHFYYDGKNPKDLTVNNDTAGGNAWEAQQSLDGVRELNLILGAGSLVLKEKDSSDGMIDIYVQGKGECDYKIKDGTLYVEGFKGIKTLGSEISENIITLVIPKGTSFEEMDIEVGAGAMEATGVAALEIDASIGAGELVLSKVESQELSVEVGAGRMEAANMVSKDVSITVSMGEGIYEGTISGNAEVECDMGNVEFSLKDSQDAFNYDVECGMGSIEIGGTGFTGLGREQRMNNHASKEFEVNCNLGNINISFQE